MILIDTNIFIETYRNNILIIEKLKEIEIKNICVSHMTLSELYYGARNKKELESIKTGLNLIQDLPITSAVSELAVSLIEKYSISHKLALADAFIAASYTSQY